MAEREERRFVELPRESVRLMAESAGVELSDEVAALLAEDVCYRLREATQNSSQFMKHTRRRKLTVEDFNRALRWSNVEAVCGYGSQDALPFRAIKEGELYFQEDREVNLVELALATNIPKGCAETAVRVHVSYLDGKGNLEPQGAVPSAVSTLTDDLLKYYQHVTRAVLGDDPQLMKVALQDLQSNSKIAALLPYFVYVVSGVKSVSHDLEQLNRLLHIARSLIQNPYLCLGSYVRSLISSVMYCTLEPLAASINPLNDHWTLRDYAAMLLSRIFWTHGDLVSGLYHQILLSLQKVLADPVRPLCSHYGAVVGLHALGWKAVERVLYPHLSTYWANLQAVLDDYSVSNAQVKADGHKVYGAILVAVERLLKMKAQQAAGQQPEGSPRHSPRPDPPAEAGLGLGRPLLQLGGGGGPSAALTPPALSLHDMYRELYDFFGDSLAARFGTGLRPPAPLPPPPGTPEKEPLAFGGEGAARKMPQLTASAAASPPEEESPRPALHRSTSLPRARGAARQPGHRPGARDVFQKCRFAPRGAPRFSFVIAGRQAGRRCRGRLFQTSFPQHHGPGHVSRYAQKLPMIGRTARPARRVKVVPPSMRRIRAQKGQGIAAQMSQFSSSSGNMSVMSDSAAVIFASRQNSDMGFHSLPRAGARVSLQSLEQTQSISRQTEDIAGTLPHQISKLQVDDGVVHLRNNPTTGTVSRPKSQEVRSYDSEKSTSPACVVSPHATYSTSVIPNATLSSSSEVIVIHTAQSAGSLDNKMGGSAVYPKPRDNPVASNAISGKEDHHSSSGNWSESSSTRHSQTSDTIPSNTVMMLSLGDSAVSLSTPGNAEAGSQSANYGCRNNLSLPNQSQDSDGRSESSYSGERTQAAVNSTEHWLYKSAENSETSSRKVACTTPGCATPGSNLSSSSLERTSAREDSTSLYSVEQDGYYSSMPVDSGLKSDMPCNSSNAFGNPRDSVINVFEGKEKKHQDDPSGQGDKSLVRNISLKKAKKPPLPPSRTDSLRRVPKKKAQSNGQVLDETLIATLQHSLQLNLKCKNSSSPSQSPCSDYEDPWVLRSRSQSSVSASSSMMSTTAPNLYSICTVTPSQSETSSIKSEYADQWGYYSDYAAVADDHAKSPVTHSASTSSALSDYSISHFSDGSRASVPQVPGGLAKPKSTSPEKSHRVTSPSSGYSSQSNTPTALTPVPVLLKSASSGNGKSKLKPKVPERKSSLLSSVSISSSSTSLSSNTSTEGSMSVKKMDPTPSSPLDSGAPPPTPPLSTPPPHCPELSPPYPPPPPPAEVMDLALSPASPTFPPPPPEADANSSFAHSVQWLPQETSVTSFSSPVPPPTTFPLAVPPPAPPLDPKLTKGATIYPQYSFKKRNQEDPCYSPVKQPFNKQDASRPVMPLVTTKALQMVQLRSVKKATEGEPSPESASETTSQEKGTVSSSSQSSLKPSLSLRLSNSLGEEEMKTHGTSFKNSAQTLARSSPLTPSDNIPALDSDQKSASTVGLSRSIEAVSVGTATEDMPESPVQSKDFHSAMSPQGSPAPPDKTQVILPNKKPPPISKKPKLFLVVPPPQLDLTVEKIAEVSDTVRGAPSPTKRDAVLAHCEEARNCLTDGLSSSEMDSGSLVPEGGAAGVTFSETVGASAFVAQPAASPDQEEARQEEQPAFDEGSSSGSSQDSGSNTDGHLSQENESAEVFESDTANSSFLPSSSYGEETDGVATPARPRTTEDLFAAIHRSKRKVLGRKDSEDERTRNHSPSPPVTPTGASPTLSTLKQAGSIQRSVRKSSTSNDNFKALLLKKGSRCDTSSRMSAAEMLKNTDPRFHRAKTDASPDLSDSPASCSPSKSKRAQEEWAKSEGLMPRSMSFSGTRYGRSRTPPSAASSKYNVRNRIQSSPMTVISEGDGEVVEQSEGRVRRTLEEQQERQLDMFNSDEIDMNDFPYAEEPGCKETLDPTHLDLMTQPGTSGKYLSPSAEES